MFGSEAAKILDYVECFPDGVGKGRKIAKECEIVKIEGFPTWVIKGKVKYTFSNELQPNYCLNHSSYQCVLFFFSELTRQTCHVSHRFMMENLRFQNSLMHPALLNSPVLLNFCSVSFTQKIRG